MRARGLVMALAAMLAFGCAPTVTEDKVPAVSRVDRILVDKSAHRMTVFRANRPLRTFKVALGSGGLAPKVSQGDNRVPEGRYVIAGRNPGSAFHLSLKIGYPTPAQVAAARARGIDPGGDIMIHGLPNGQGWVGAAHRQSDWTAGCIAVTNEEIEWLWQAVPDGTPIDIRG
ncbi:MAG: L,D-transpeptidase family protein [Sphingomicrobium sp.]